uniref:Uncharacterized protein n=1 Tax=Utricularia reniformis TaxID=192314 RepID=A0A1Y0B303_9LAMI|nr:hypothetical protein AEK19_MT1599 [Utricularia reniformis]ART31781.1 hypothetical protein AEK19_MT1599 [Utricularia reniformis]
MAYTFGVPISVTSLSNIENLLSSLSVESLSKKTINVTKNLTTTTGRPY